MKKVSDYNILNYECVCGHKWETTWDKVSKDMCTVCNKYVDPKEKRPE